MNEQIAYNKSITNIPKRYQDAELKGITTAQNDLIEKLRENWNSGERRDFILYGKIGCGKTHIMIALLNTLIEKGVHAKYATEFQILEAYARKEYKKFDNFSNAPVLVIDEIGKRELAEWQKMQLEELSSHRYNEKLITMFITNQNKENFKKIIGERVEDRLRDNKVIQFTIEGESLRGKQKKENNVQ